MHDGNNEKSASNVFGANESPTGPVERSVDPSKILNGTSPAERRGALFVPVIPSSNSSKLEPSASVWSRIDLDLEERLPAPNQLAFNLFGSYYLS